MSQPISLSWEWKISPWVHLKSSRLFSQYPKIATTPAMPGTCQRKNDRNHFTWRILFHSQEDPLFCEGVITHFAHAYCEFFHHLDSFKRVTGAEWSVYWVSSEVTSETEAQMSPPMELLVQDMVQSLFASSPATRKSISAYLGTIGGAALVNRIMKGQNISQCWVSNPNMSHWAILWRRPYLLQTCWERLIVLFFHAWSQKETLELFSYLKASKLVVGPSSLRCAITSSARRWKAGIFLVSYSINTVKPFRFLSKTVTQKFHYAHNSNLPTWHSN